MNTSEKIFLIIMCLAILSMLTSLIGFAVKNDKQFCIEQTTYTYEDCIVKLQGWVMKTNYNENDADEKQEYRNIFLEKVQETCLRHNGLCDAGNGVMVVDTHKFNIIERKK